MKTVKIITIFFIFFQTPSFLIFSVQAETPRKEKDIIQHRHLEKESFAVAENLFKKSKYDQALVQYKNHIKYFPEGDFVENAVFQSGEIYRLRKNYFTAIRYYQLLKKINIKTDLYNESEYKIALCYLQSGHYENALLKLESIYSKPHDGRRKWDILFLMGKTFEGMQDKRAAFKKYMLSMLIAQDIELKEKSEQRIVEMIQHELNLDDLVNLAEAMPNKFPLGRILFRIAEKYEGQRDYEQFQKYITRFLNDFPDHELHERGIEKINSLLEKKAPIKTKIGCILPLSGEAAIQGQKILQGIQLAFNLLPDYKRKNIELIVKDSKRDTETVAAIVEDFGADNDVVCVIGQMFSKTADIATEKAEMSKLPMISPSASIKGLPDTSQYFFRNSLTQELQGKAIAEYAINNLELNRFVMFYVSDLYGTRLKDVFLNQINILGGEVLASESFTPTQNDFKEQILDIGGLNDPELKKKALESISEESKNILSEDMKIIEYSNVDDDKDDVMSTVLVEVIKQKSRETRVLLDTKDENFDKSFEEREIITEKEVIKNQNEYNADEIQESESTDDIEEEIFFNPILKVHYDAIFIPAYPDQVGLIAPQLAFYNINNVQLLGGNNWNSEKIIELGGKYVDGAIFVDGFFPGSYLSSVRKFSELYEDFFGEAPDVLSAQAFDAANLVFDIVLKTRVDRQVMKKELLKIKDYKGVSGETTILPNGDSEKSLFFISIKGNKRVQIN